MSWILLLALVCLVGICAAGTFTAIRGRRTAASRQDHGVEP